MVEGVGRGQSTERGRNPFRRAPRLGTESTRPSQPESIRQGSQNTNAGETAPAPLLSPAGSPIPANFDSAEHGNGQLRGRLGVTVAACRRLRCPLSLSMLEMDGFARLRWTSARWKQSNLRGNLGALCAGIDHPHVEYMQTHEARFALILPDCDRSRASARQPIYPRDCRGSCLLRSRGAGPLTIASEFASVAAGPRNFAAAIWPKKAQARCLDAARISRRTRSRASMCIEAISPS